MSENNAKLVTIYTEAALETRLKEAIDELGLAGYTITNARGKGTGGSRTAAWDANASIRVEVICSEEMALTLSAYLQETYYDDYSMVSFLSDVQVVRPEKFL